jgi:hypothetical protein
LPGFPGCLQQPGNFSPHTSTAHYQILEIRESGCGRNVSLRRHGIGKESDTPPRRRKDTDIKLLI